jgi:hypothetical protein
MSESEPLGCERVSFTCTNTNVAERVQPSANPFSPVRIREVCPECFDALAAMALDEELSNR